MLNVKELQKIKKALKKVKESYKRIRNGFDYKDFKKKGWVYNPNDREIERSYQIKRLEKRLGTQYFICSKKK
jgi:hypothetical protein